MAASLVLISSTAPHHLVAKSSLPCVGRIEVGELAHIAVDGIRLSKCLTVDFKHRQAPNGVFGLRRSSLRATRDHP